MPARALLLLTAAVLFGAPCRCQEDPVPGTLTTAQREAGWRPLFDGRTTGGWRGFRRAGFPEEGWVVEDGTLHIRAGGRGGDLVTEKRFLDFELAFQWKVAPGANSGVFYRVVEEGRAPWLTGPEYQILDDAQHPDSRRPETSAAALYGLVAAEDKTLRPAGAWNTGRIRVHGSEVAHWLNGERVLQTRIKGPQWERLVAGSKFADMPHFARSRLGHIALQDHGDAVWYRDLRIRALPAPDARPLLAGDGLEGWKAFPEEASAAFVPGDDILDIKGEPRGYLRTKTTHRDFVLRLQWRWPGKPGNSGVLLRVTGPDRIWPSCIEAQLRSGAAGDLYNLSGSPVKAPAERTTGIRTAASQRNERPLGEWNAYEIVVQGGTVTLSVNGRMVNRMEGIPREAGSIGLQSEGAHVQVRNLRLIPLEP